MIFKKEVLYLLNNVNFTNPSVILSNQKQHILQELNSTSSNFEAKLKKELYLKTELQNNQVVFKKQLTKKENTNNNFSYSKQVKFNDIIEKVSKKYNLSSELINSIIKTESNFNPNAVSEAGAVGLMQIMPKTAEHLGINDPLNPQENIEGGVKYLKEMLDRYKNIELALAAYNAGPSNVDKYNGIPPFKETEEYIKKVLKPFSN